MSRCALLLRSAAAAAAVLAVARACPAQKPPMAGARLAPAGAAPMPQAGGADEFQRLELPGAKVRAGVRKVVSAFTWHRDLDQAASVARAQGKPIVWVQALGELRGLT